ncbi:MAG: alkaline phosphatase family protein [Thermoanaerobaculia bacterium]
MSRHALLRRRVLAAAGALLLLAPLACRRGPQLEPPAGAARLPQVRLVVMIVVDQLGWDTLTRLEPALTGGLRRLLDHGVVFSDAHHLHAATVTAPGHAALATGQHPRRHGIVGNDWFDREAGDEVYCVLDDDGGTISPRRLLGSTIADWIRAADGRGRVFAASGKDRGTVLLAGHAPDGVYWYDEGEFVSSAYYADETPEWLALFHEEHPAERWFGTLWEPLPETLAALDALVVEPDEGAFPRDFPHSLGDNTVTPDDSYYDDVYASPFADAYLGELARALVEAEGLGADAHLDFLGLSFSAPDAVGHDYGPESAELVDTVLRLDRTLGELLDYLEERIGAERLLVALSSDHGVAPLPEARHLAGLEAWREGAHEVVCEQSVLERLQRRFGPGVRFAWPGYVDREALAEAEVDEAAVLAYAAQLLASCPQVAEVWTRDELSREKPPKGPHGSAVWRSFHPLRSPDLLVTYQPWYVPLHSRGTTHGSPWPYDAHVPIILLLPDREGREIRRAVGTVDLAPTLATLLALPRPADLDGVDLTELVLAE